MIQISDDALRDGCGRAQDLFFLNRLRTAGEAASGLDAVFGALGFNEEMRAQLLDALRDLVPVSGVPALEATAALSLEAGVLVGLLIADSTLPTENLDIPVLPEA